MKDLRTYLLELDGCVTPADTMGMGNPGEIEPGVLTEPVCATAERERDKKKKKKKPSKSLAESLFDKDLITRDILIGDVYKLDE